MSVNAMTRLMLIIQQAVSATDYNQQAQVIVDGVSRELEVDVCSLYRLNDERDLLLVSSHGLDNSHPVTIPRGQGLVGEVARTGQVINIINPEQHPAYFFVAESGEARLLSFCGVPLVHHAQVIGVLVVQKKTAEPLTDDEEALLLTLASHLALVLINLPRFDRLHQAGKTQLVLKGVSGALGLAIGRVLRRQGVSLDGVLPQYSDNAIAEQLAWETLRAETLADLRRERRAIEQSMGEGMAALMDAYQQFLLDPVFVSYLQGCLKQGSSLPWAIKQTVSHFVELFLAIDDDYLQARHEDIVHLGDKLYQVLTRSNATQNLQEVGESGARILCGDMVSVSDIVSLPVDRLAGIVCSGGAALSHIAVFANALGIPAVMGVGNLPAGDGDLLIVDGDHGEVHLNPLDAVVAEYQNLIAEQQQFSRITRNLCHGPVVTRDGQAVSVMANSGLQADILPGLENGADGIGLYRTELPFMIHPNLPTEEEQIQTYRRVLDAYNGRPVCFRLLDIGGDKPLAYLPAVDEENPALGLRGIRFLLDNELILKTQLRAILKASAGAQNTQLLLPMLSNTRELTTLSRLLDNEVQRLEQQGVAAHRPSLGVMVEVPGVAAMLPFWRRHIDFVSIGSNDLSQYLLAVDRNNPLVASYYDALHPAVLHEIYRIVKTARQLDLPLSLCGEMAADPVSVLLLLGMGVRKFSMSAARIPTTKWLIQQVETGELEQLVAEALRLDEADSIRELGNCLLGSLPDDAKSLIKH